MRNKLLILSILIISLFSIFTLADLSKSSVKGDQVRIDPIKSYWFMLHRKSSEEFLYYGISGDVKNSKIVRKFQIKSGIPGYSPTPLPNLLGREYWLLTNKESSAENPDTAPYFLQLDVPATPDWPYGPAPYEECGGQCDWVLPGYFGLHGIGGNSLKLSREDPGSSGCVRHSDEDITYLYNLLDPQKEEIRYYIEDI